MSGIVGVLALVTDWISVAAGLEPDKAGFADQRLDRFGIATL
jgi:hypothetical protein